MTPQFFARLVWAVAYFAIVLVVILGFFLAIQHDQLQVTCRYALASTSPAYVAAIKKELPWCRD